MAQSLIVVLLVSACSTPSGTRYNSSDVGTPIETTQGTVVASRVVDVSGDATAVGPVAGGAAGASGAAIAFGGSGLAAVLGGLVGAGAGYLTEQRMRSGEGIEYVVEMADGRTVTLVQNRDSDEQPIPDGTPVLVQIGAGYSRVLAHPRAELGAPGSDWVDPDAAAGSGTPNGAPSPSPPPASRAQQLLQQ